jgi:PAS domain S-box-containing protein
MKLAHEVLLTLAYVSQISDPDSVRSRFIESLNGLDEGFSFEFVDQLPPGVPENRVLPIATMRWSFGYAVMAESPDPGKDELAIFRNAFKFLAALLENRMQARALESRNESLLREIHIEKSLVRTVLDTLPVGVWVADEKGTIIMGNAASEKIWAGTRYTGIDQFEELKGWWSDTGKSIEPEEWGIARAIKAGETVIDQEIDIECFDGTRKNILHSAAPLLNDNRRVIGAVGVNQNITDRKKAENELRESDRRFQNLVQNIPVGVYRNVPGPEGRFIIANQAIVQMFGYASVEELMRVPVADLYIDPAARHNFTEKLVSQGQVFREELLLKKKDGTPICGAVTAKVIRSNDGTIAYFDGFVEDVTERKMIEARLWQAQKLESVGILAGGIAHDFNNILYPLLGFTELLKEDLPKDSPLHAHIDEILRAAYRSKDLVKQILAYSRKGGQDKKPIQLHPIVKEALKLLRSSIPTTIDIQQDLYSDCGVVMADPTQIHQIVMNLATNAYHAMEDTGGTLTVSLKQVESAIESDPSIIKGAALGKYVLLTVSDTGTGIEKAILDKIFDPYFTTKGAGKGTGLGLSVVQGIVKTHKGDILIDSTPGKGTEVRVYLPVMEKMVEEKRIENSEPLPGGAEKILLVDDEEVIARMEKQMLERLGYHVTAHTSSIDALNAFKTNIDAFDLVISDMTMPNMNGIQLARELVSVQPGTPIIICTGFSDKIDEKSAKAMGIKEFLLKPVVKSDLAKMVRKVLDEANTSNHD